MFLQFLFGFPLMIVGLALWRAGRNQEFKQWLEKTFLEPGDGLFDKGKSYSVYVRWMRYVAFFAGLAMVAPSTVIYDIIIGMIAAGVFWWMSSQKVKHDAVVASAETEDA